MIVFMTYVMYQEERVADPAADAPVVAEAAVTGVGAGALSLAVSSIRARRAQASDEP